MRLSIALAFLVLLTGCSDKAKNDQAASDLFAKNCDLSLRFADRQNALAPYTTIKKEHILRVVPAPPEYQGEMSLNIELTEAGRKRLERDPYNKTTNRLVYFCDGKEIQRAFITAPLTSPVIFHLGDKAGT